MEKKHLIYTESQALPKLLNEKRDIMMFHRNYTFVDDEELKHYKKYYTTPFVNIRKIFIQPVMSIFHEIGYINLSLN